MNTRPPFARGPTHSSRLLLGRIGSFAGNLALTTIAPLSLVSSASAKALQDQHIANTTNDVPMFRGSPARTGEMPGPGPDPAYGVEAIWRFATGDGVTSSPAIVGGVVYVGSHDGFVYAIDALTGMERWRFGTADGVESSPAVIDGVVYVGSGSLARIDHYLYAIDATTGTEHWRFNAGGIVSTSPVVVAGVVYISSGGVNLTRSTPPRALNVGDSMPVVSYGRHRL